MDKYTKLQKIGQGSFGSAFLCVKAHEPHGRKYVIKEIRMDPRDQGSALREAKLLAALDHPNIIACRESFLAGPNVLCIVTEFADGGDLRKHLTDRAARRAPLAEPELLDLFLQCCLALKHLHDRKIIHRDIKPENVFLTASGVVKLGDFGVATVLSHTLACAQTLTGTPYYTSPEICLGKKYTNKTDVWSLGCVLYELATFSHAFNGRSQRQLFENIVHGSFVPVASAAPPGARYSPALVALVAEMLQKNPRDRPSVNQLIRRPVLLARAQSFLSQRGVADALAHTVLHGQHIFQKKPPQASPAANQPRPQASPVRRPQPQPQPQAAGMRRAPMAAAAGSPAGGVRAVQYEPPRSRKKPEPVAAAPRRGVAAAAAGVPRRNSLKSSGSKRNVLRKLVSPKKPAKADPVKAPVVLPPPPPVAVAAAPAKASPAMRQLEQRLQQRKQEAAVSKPVPARAVAGARTPVAKPQDKKPAVAAASPAPSSSGSVSDRVSAFNAQWQAQRKQILRNLAAPSPSPALPPPPPVAAAAAAPASAVAPPAPAPLLATGVVVQRGKRPSSAAALAAARQREAMRRDIQEKKKLQQRARAVAAAASAVPLPSPLDDPVILVQNLPDYAKNKPAAKPAAGAVLPPPPPAPIAAVANAVEREETEELEEEVEEEGEEEEDVPTPDSTVAARANLEFQRMLLQLQSVVDEPEPTEEDDEEEEEGGEEAASIAAGPVAVVAPLDRTSGSGKDEELRGTMTLPPPPYNAVDKPEGGVLTMHVLQDAGFKAALRARLRGDATESPVQTEENAALAWMHQYIRELL